MVQGRDCSSLLQLKPLMLAWVKGRVFLLELRGMLMWKPCVNNRAPDRARRRTVRQELSLKAV